MALTDIDFSEGEGQDFIVELPQGTLETPADILVESESDAFLLLETPEVVGGGGEGDIFIIND
jgi:hypothetical protein